MDDLAILIGKDELDPINTIPSIARPPPALPSYASSCVH